MPRPLSSEAVKFGSLDEKFCFACDKPLAEKIRTLAIEENHESPSRVIRRLLRVGAEAEGIAIYGD